MASLAAIFVDVDDLAINDDVSPDSVLGTTGSVCGAEEDVGFEFWGALVSVRSQGLSVDLVLCNWLDCDVSSHSVSEIEEYDDGGGSNRMKNDETNTKDGVPTASTSKKSEVSSGKAKAAIVEKKNALKPKAASGNAVAEPL
ncbi:hypothetical protein PRK78_002740 [Emydomyces testavorans]|uniref:Uncharacterized protein n=1 Tax=Emydomyces testavorans TaxID=2070801 RepID=A0AAF0DGD2_9EURO|nr:hypothetical protein PRK78_002740 [Emydomyces testavorans]